MELGPVCVDTSRKSNSIVRIGEVGCQKEVEWVSFMLNWKCSANIQSLQNPPLNSNLNLEKQKAHLKASYWSIYQLPLSRLLLILFFFLPKSSNIKRLSPFCSHNPTLTLEHHAFHRKQKSPLDSCSPTAMDVQKQMSWEPDNLNPQNYSPPWLQHDPPPWCSSEIPFGSLSIFAVDTQYIFQYQWVTIWG